MASGHLTLDIGALKRNWTTLNALTDCETGAVVKANGYGFGAETIGRALADAGCRTFFVAMAEEGSVLRTALGPEPRIFVFSGHMEGDTQAIRNADLIPLLNSVDQMLRHVEALPSARFGIQLDTGMNRLGMEPAEWQAVRDIAISQKPELLLSHLACGDDPSHPMNAKQLSAFTDMTAGLDIPRSLSATAGILLGPEYHFDLTRPGIGIFGGQPFMDAHPVVRIDLPVIQVRELQPGETVGYGNAWTATRVTKVATVSSGYADGLIRTAGPNAKLYAGNTPCPVVGRISMDMMGVDVTDALHEPESLEILGPHQSIDTLADMAGTIGHEILTSIGARYHRDHIG